MDYLREYDEATRELERDPGNAGALRRLIDLYEEALSDHEIRDSIPLYVTDLGNAETRDYLQEKIEGTQDEFLIGEFEDWRACLANKASSRGEST